MRACLRALLRLVPLVIAAAAACRGAPAQAQALGRELRQVDVRVVEVAGTRAYVVPGRAAHLRVGDQVRFGNRRYPVLAVNLKNAVIGLRAARLARGARGVASVRVERAQTFATRARPRPLAAFARRWTTQAPPAAAERPRRVPLGAPDEARRNRALLGVDYQRIQPLSGGAYGIGRTRLRAQLHAELESVPLRLDADAFAEFWQSRDLELRPGNASRPFITLRQLELGYQGETVQAAAGRLRYAARTLGMLDGARLSTRLTPTLSLAGFGGMLADPRSSAFASQASRFGAELGWRDDAAGWRPRASLTLQGSSFLGQLDERRVTALVESFPAFGRLGTRAEVSFFDADNPWNAASTELTAAGADALFELDALRFGLSLDMRRPERSLWLSSFLPRGYFCVARAAPGFGAEPCLGDAERYAAALSAGWRAALWSLDAGATWTTTRGAEAEQGTGFVNLRRRELLGALRFDAGVSASRGTLLESLALNVATGAALLSDAADLSLYYRPSVQRYRAENEGSVEHGLGLRFWWAASQLLELNGSVDALTGRDVDVLMLQLGAAFRPRF